MGVFRCRPHHSELARRAGPPESESEVDYDEIFSVIDKVVSLDWVNSHVAACVINVGGDHEQAQLGVFRSEGLQVP